MGFVSFQGEVFCFYLKLMRRCDKRRLSSEALLLLHQAHVLVDSGVVLPHPDHTFSEQLVSQHVAEHACSLSATHSVHVGVGMGVQGGKGLCSPPVRSDREYLMFVYSRPLILLF